MKKLFFFFFLLPLIGSAQIIPNFNYTQTCFGNQTTLVGSSSLPDASIASWQWDLDTTVSAAYSMSGKMIVVVFTKDTMAVRLKITPVFGAADSITKNVIIDPLPQPNFVANNLCNGKTATYISSSTISSGMITQYKWDFNNDGIDDAFGDTVTYVCGAAQTYITKLTCVSDKGCSAFTQKATTVYPNPVAAFSFSGTGLCDSTKFLNTSTDTLLDFYAWNFGDGNSVSTSGNASHIYSGAGVYNVSLIAVSQSGCRDTNLQSVTILHATVVSDSSYGFCAHDSTKFVNTSTITAPNIYEWNFGDGNTAATSGNAAHIYTAAGNYNVTLIGISQSGCRDTAYSPININPSPHVSITANDTVIFSGGSVDLSANAGAVNYLWNTGATSMSINVTQAGTYSVQYTDAKGCYASASIDVIVKGIPDSVQVSSNLLTPNGDGINDVLKIDNIEAYSNCELDIYNMWNDKVYSIMEYKNDWAGTNSNGQNLPAGPYYYIIKCDNKPMLKGNINILR